MSTSIFILMMANFGYIGLLPVIFFRRDGRLNLKWWLTASPFFLSALLIALHYFGVLHSWYPSQSDPWREVAATLLGGISLGLISYTLGTHNRRLALWHQDNDKPEHIVTEGAYRRIRHPFYASFIASLLASALICASPWALTISLCGMLMLNYTAAQEERRLLASTFGEQYGLYIARSGRFLPRFRKAAG